MVGASGLEPPTPTLSGWCSNLLSYAPIMDILNFYALIQLPFTTLEDTVVLLALCAILLSRSIWFALDAWWR